MDDSERQDTDLLEMAAQAYDVDRWLLSNKLVSASVKNDLFAYGAIAHEDEAYIKAIELSVDVENKRVNYTLYAPQFISKAYGYVQKHKDTNSILKLLKLLFLKKRYGNLRFDIILDRFVKDRCGMDWTTTTIVKDIKTYKEEPDVGEQ